MTETRKLAAILCSDVVGYSRLAGADEDRILARLRALRSDLIDPTIAVHNGRVVKRTGDGSIVEFRSVVDAVRCAIEVQNAMVERNAGVSEDRRIVFRIGIHLGDVVEESDGDLMGDGVNIAARLEGIAQPGAICISEDAYRQVKARLDLKVSDLGPTELKNIAEPIHVYSLEVGASAGPKAAAQGRPARLVAKPGGAFWRWRTIAVTVVLALLAAGAVVWRTGLISRMAGVPVAEDKFESAPHLSIVVLPFANLSGDASQDYFADGITENLTTDLSRLSGSFVIARNTAFTYKGKNADARQIGKELGVRYVMEGSVQRDQSQVRVNAQLIDAQSGGQLWAQRFDRPLANLFSMQDEIVASLAGLLGAQLITNEARRAERISNPDSMDLYFQGMAWFNKGHNLDDLAKARDFFERALARDPNNLEASLGALSVDALSAQGYRTDDRAERYAAVEGKLTKLLSQSPNDAWTHYWVGRIKVETNRGAEGIAEAERALALDPNLASAHALIGLAKLVNGHPEETEAHELEALRVSPHDTDANIWTAYIALAKLFLKDDEAALANYRLAFEINQNYPIGHFLQAAAFAELGRIDEARATVQGGLALNPGFTIRRYRTGAQSDNPIFLKRREQIIEAMRKAGVPEE
jgi:TolB-like protein/class 3 adenylate cyclase/Tfp pilus assembly protein PilF